MNKKYYKLKNYIKDLKQTSIREYVKICQYVDSMISYKLMIKSLYVL